MTRLATSRCRPESGPLARGAVTLLWLLLTSTAVSAAGVLQGFGYGPSPEEARQRAAADLVTTIQVQVKSVVEACTQVKGSTAMDCGSRVLRRTAAELPMLGLRYDAVPGESERYGARALLDPATALPLYRSRLAELTAQFAAARAALEKASDNRRRHELLTTQLTRLRAISDHRFVALALGDTVAEPDTSEAALGSELAALEDSVDSLTLAARVLLRGVDARFVRIDPPGRSDSDEVTPFAAALVDALRAEGLGRDGPDVRVGGEYRVLENGQVEVALEFRQARTGEVGAMRIARLQPAAYAGYRIEPRAPNLDRLLKEGVALSDTLRADITTGKGSRDLLFEAGEEIRVLVRLNRSGYFYLVGHVVREGEQFSYLLPLDGAAASDPRPPASAFIRYVPPDEANHLIEIGTFTVIAPHGTEHLQLVASTGPLDRQLPATRFDADTGYHVIPGTAGDAAQGVSITRGLRLNRRQSVEGTEATLTFTTRAQ